jgi:hypothetical protein
MYESGVFGFWNSGVQYAREALARPIIAYGHEEAPAIQLSGHSSRILRPAANRIAVLFCAEWFEGVKEPDDSISAFHFDGI